MGGGGYGLCGVCCALCCVVVCVVCVARKRCVHVCWVAYNDDRYKDFVIHLVTLLFGGGSGSEKGREQQKQREKEGQDEESEHEQDGGVIITASKKGEPIKEHQVKKYPTRSSAQGMFWRFFLHFCELTIFFPLGKSAQEAAPSSVSSSSSSENKMKINNVMLDLARMTASPQKMKADEKRQTEQKEPKKSKGKEGARSPSPPPQEVQQGHRLRFPTIQIPQKTHFLSIRGFHPHQLSTGKGRAT
jgi:hypothetical protein